VADRARRVTCSGPRSTAISRWVRRPVSRLRAEEQAICRSSRIGGKPRLNPDPPGRWLFCCGCSRLLRPKLKGGYQELKRRCGARRARSLLREELLYFVILGTEEAEEEAPAVAQPAALAPAALPEAAISEAAGAVPALAAR
jgi:hypothetical protein